MNSLSYDMIFVVVDAEPNWQQLQKPPNSMVFLGFAHFIQIYVRFFVI